MRTNRGLLADPDPVAPIVLAAADTLRARLNGAWVTWETAWTAGEARLHDDSLWNRLTPEQKLDIRSRTGLRQIERPAVDTPEAIADALDRRSLEAWEDVTKALGARDAADIDRVGIMAPGAGAGRGEYKFATIGTASPSFNVAERTTSMILQLLLRSKRSSFMTLVQALTKSRTNISLASLEA